MGELQTVPQDIPLKSSFGSKELWVAGWDKNTRSVSLYLTTNPRESHKPNETTEVYKQFMDACKRIAHRDNKPITVLFRPAVGSNLHKWGLTKGAELFGGWDSIVEDKKVGMIFKKKINP